MFAFHVDINIFLFYILMWFGGIFLQVLPHKCLQSINPADKEPSLVTDHVFGRPRRYNVCLWTFTSWNGIRAFTVVTVTSEVPVVVQEVHVLSGEEDYYDEDGRMDVPVELQHPVDTHPL